MSAQQRKWRVLHFSKKCCPNATRPPASNSPASNCCAFADVRLQAWLNFFSSEMHKGGFSPLFYKGMPEEGKDVFRARLVARFVHLDQHLKDNEYLMGRDYSLADAHMFVVSNWASWVNFDLSPHANVVSHRKRISARAAVHSALEAEGLIPWPISPP